MKTKKILVTLSLLCATSLFAGCASTQTSSNTNTSKGGSKELKLAHGLAEDHPVHLALADFSRLVEEGTNGEVKVKIFPNGLLGNERESLEQMKSGAVDITKVSASALENFSDIYSAFTVPYLFNNLDHFYEVMDGEIAQDIYKTTQEQGILGLTYFDSGARSFYTKSTPINTPADLKGLKIRVMENPSSIKMMECFNASATPMPYGDIYTALQQGVLDGAENNPTALTLGKHGEVAGYYSFDEHARIPDILVVSTKAWEGLTEEQQKVFNEAAEIVKEEFKTTWNDSIEEALKQAEEQYGVQYVYPDKAPFQEAVQPIYEELKAKPEVYAIVEKILEAGK